jgi:DNA-directed RNA polymerase specialized sigma subunit
MNKEIFNIDVKIFKLKKQKEIIRKRIAKSIKHRNMKIIKLHKKGYSLRYIGKKVGLSHERINQIIYNKKLKGGKQ